MALLFIVATATDAAAAFIVILFRYHTTHHCAALSPKVFFANAVCKSTCSTSEKLMVYGNNCGVLFLVLTIRRIHLGKRLIE